MEKCLQFSYLVVVALDRDHVDTPDFRNLGCCWNVKSHCNTLVAEDPMQGRCPTVEELVAAPFCRHRYQAHV